jgi:murein DD-endopeptidase MepM/ murein hydrolase activator NlpD
MTTQGSVRRTGVSRSNTLLTWRWLATATAAALIVGSAPATGGVPSTRGHWAAPGPGTVLASAVSPVVVGGSGSAGYLPPSGVLARQASVWERPSGLEVNRDGSAADGESVLRAVDKLALVGANAGLPGGLRLAHPVSTRHITSPFGWRTNPTGSGQQIHIGQDYAIACGSPVRAAEAGTVVQSAWAGHSGHRITVDHGSGVQTAYSHNSLLVAKVGDKVAQGSLVALSGTTGNSTGCHVHFEVYLDGKWTDPALYLPRIPGQPKPLSPSELRDVQGVGKVPDAISTASLKTPAPSTEKPSTLVPAADQPPKPGAAAPSTEPPRHSEPPAAKPAAPKPPAKPSPTPPPAPSAPTPKPPVESPKPMPPSTPVPTPTTPTPSPLPAPAPTPTPVPQPAPPETTPPTTPPATPPATPDPAPSDPAPIPPAPQPTDAEPPASPVASVPADQGTLTAAELEAAAAKAPGDRTAEEQAALEAAGMADAPSGTP